jgi:hypothetical protein
MPELNRMPWRSVRLPQLLTLVALAVGLPMFLRSPPWCDITLHQLSARNIATGGTLYRDLFDTNPPGYVWLLTVLHRLCGPNVFVLRLVDLSIVCGIVALGDRFAKWSGATVAARWWAVAGAALFYPFAAESLHAQRDGWMLLPALAATALRVRRAGGSNARPFCASCIEGALWGAAVWIKPHVVPVALAVWLVTVRRVSGAAERPRRAALLDLMGNLCAGALVGIAGLAWLVLSGTWGPFLDVMLVWNPLYLKMDGADLRTRLNFQMYWFPPWTYWQPFTAVLALASVLDATLWAKRSEAERGPVGNRLPAWLWDATAPPAARFARGVLGALYLVWAALVLLVQRELHYAHVPEALLAFALWAAHRWGCVLACALYLAACGAVWLMADAAPPVRAALDSMGDGPRDVFVPRHPLFDPERLAAWPDCWRLAMSDADRYQLWDRLRARPVPAEAPGWVELNEVAQYLRSRGAGDGEIVGWHDSPHAVYLILDVKPGFRFMHVHMATRITERAEDPARRDAVRIELRRAARVRFVISDLEWVVAVAPGSGRDESLVGPAVSPTDLLPANRPRIGEFPFTEPAVFRSKGGTGRYVVHELRARAGTAPR